MNADIFGEGGGKTRPCPLRPHQHQLTADERVNVLLYIELLTLCGTRPCGLDADVRGMPLHNVADQYGRGVGACFEGSFTGNRGRPLSSDSFSALIRGWVLCY